jgi:mannose-6-phosphate isomerase-like protein (cupin superfamily)
MATQTQTILAVKKSLDTPDEARPVGRGLLELVNVDDNFVARLTLQPGWRWSTDVKPLVKTESCQVSHVQYIISGRLAVKMDDGTRLELKAGDAVAIGPGHDAWVVGDEPFVAIDFTGNMKGYGRTLASQQAPPVDSD